MLLKGLSMTRLALSIIMYSVCLFICMSVAAGQSQQSQLNERAKIGLVLSGGGAKGAAHVGVLKVLEAHNIAVDYIAGTSIGAYVGAMYALGYSADDIETIMLQGAWDTGYSDSIPREHLSYRDKQLRDRYNIPINIGISEGKIKIPKGLIHGQSVSQLLYYSTDRVKQFDSFDDLAIGFRAVATNLATNEAVILDKGSIVKAIQASAAVPGALQPIVINNQLLVDGGIANNLPVDVVKAMGADIVIAVDIGSPLVSTDKLNSTVAVLEQLSTMLTQASTAKQKKLLNGSDILLRPDIDELSTTDFSIMAQALALGEQAAQEQLGQLTKLSLDEGQYQYYVNNKKQKRALWLTSVGKPIYKVEVQGASAVNEQLIKQRLNIKDGQIVNKEELDAAIMRVYALNQFERVEAEFIDTPQGRKLVVAPKPKSWGPNYFYAGFNWEDDFNFDSAVSLNLAYTMSDITADGAQWRNELEFGFQKRLSTELYQPLDINKRFYGIANYQYERERWDFLALNSLDYDLKHRSSSLLFGLGFNYSHYTIFEAGLIGERGSVANSFLFNDDVDYKTLGGYFKIAHDTLNSISFATRGNRFSLTTYYRDETYETSTLDLALKLNNTREKTWQINADWKGAFSIGNNTILGKVEMSTVESDAGLSVHFSQLGGFLNLSGFRKNELVGAHKLFGAVIYQHNLGHKMPLSNMPVYLGLSLEAGNVWYKQKDIDLNDLIYSSNLYLGTDTLLGPAGLGFGYTDSGESALYFFIGTRF